MGTYADLIQTSPAPTQKEEQQNRSEKRTSERSLEPTDHRTKQRTMEPSKPPTIEPSSERSTHRTIVRHSFDIYADQLQLLRQYKLEGVLMGNKDTKIGEMIREALDEYFEKHKTDRAENRSDVQTNEGTNELSYGKPHKK